LGAKEQSNIRTGADEKSAGRLLALDLGARRVGVAVCDELRLTVRALEAIERRSWKELLRRVAEQIENLGAGGLVIGLPLNIDGSEGKAAKLARETAEKFRLSIKLPVYLQDERLTTEEAKSELRARGKSLEIDQRVDSEAASIILRDFISRERS
jgi:putative Holliday junction resolvase